MTDDEYDHGPLPPDIMSDLRYDALPHAGVEREVVHRLHKGGVLSRRAGRNPWQRGSAILGGAIAAGIVFMAGVQTGVNAGVRTTLPRTESIPVSTDTAVIAAAKQYADALSRVDAAHDSSRMAALASLRIVAAQFDRLAPDNAVLSLAAGLLEGSVIRGPLGAEPIDSARSYVVWH